mmetsp:Transcript_30832/g.49875  ORF Transcript_30832/g.49875 Transcript_30832/m.49875 type:complete len:211 (+) Transcript_30832:459-1091(+)
MSLRGMITWSGTPYARTLVEGLFGERSCKPSLSVRGGEDVDDVEIEVVLGESGTARGDLGVGDVTFFSEGEEVEFRLMGRVRERERVGVDLETGAKRLETADGILESRGEVTMRRGDSGVGLEQLVGANGTGKGTSAKGLGGGFLYCDGVRLANAWLICVTFSSYTAYCTRCCLLSSSIPDSRLATASASCICSASLLFLSDSTSAAAAA